jgi:hypothetical protein
MSHDRPLWLAIFIVTSLLVAAAAGLIIWLISKSVGKAILTGASAFAGAVLLFIAMAAFLAGASTAPAVVPPVNSSSAPSPLATAGAIAPAS